MSSFVRPTTRKTSEFSVSFPELPTFTPQFRGMKLIQKQYNHDVLVLYSHDLDDVVLQTLPTGVPVKVTIRADGFAKEWTGYVSFVAREEGSGVEFTTRVHCIGSSFPLKRKTTRVFSNMSITEAVEVLAKETGFIPLVEPHPEKFAQLSIAGHSYWEWLTEQAHRIGYAVRVDGPYLWFQSIDSTIISTMTDSPEFTQVSSYPKDSASQERNITFFRVFRGEYVELPGDLNTSKMVAGVDTRTGKSFGESSDSFQNGVKLRERRANIEVTEFRSDQVANSLRSAQIRAQSLRSTARYTVPAQAHVAGDPRITPFSTVNLSGLGDFLDGYWVVKEVEHVIQSIGTYVSEVKLLGDGSGKSSLRGGARSVDRKMGVVNVSNALLGKTTWDNSGRQNESLLRGIRSTPLAVPSGFSESSARWTSR
jgi:phage protein D